MRKVNDADWSSWKKEMARAIKAYHKINRIHWSHRQRANEWTDIRRDREKRQREKTKYTHEPFQLQA